MPYWAWLYGAGMLCTTLVMAVGAAKVLYHKRPLYKISYTPRDQCWSFWTWLLHKDVSSKWLILRICGITFDFGTPSP